MFKIVPDCDCGGTNWCCNCTCECIDDACHICCPDDGYGDDNGYGDDFDDDNLDVGDNVKY